MPTFYRDPSFEFKDGTGYYEAGRVYEALADH
jgi:hypothetical protein